MYVFHVCFIVCGGLIVFSGEVSLFHCVGLIIFIVWVPFVRLTVRALNPCTPFTDDIIYVKILPKLISSVKGVRTARTAAILIPERTIRMSHIGSSLIYDASNPVPVTQGSESCQWFNWFAWLLDWPLDWPLDCLNFNPSPSVGAESIKSMESL